jgi:hypothetical protein
LNDEKTSVQELQRDLETLAKDGVQTNREQLKKDMVTQFGDPRLYIREYVANAFDANASVCDVSGREDERSIRIIILDDGHGMDRQAVLDWLKLFRSVKTGARRLPVGEYGVGKLSVAAVPGQCGFVMFTSTGQEFWRLTAGCLLDDTPIQLARVTPVGFPGTRIEITFTKEDKTVDEELKTLHEILARSVRYLPMTTTISYKSNPDDHAKRSHVVRDEWGPHSEAHGYRDRFRIGPLNYDVILGIGDQHTALYKRGILVSDTYDLLNIEMRDRLRVPHLRILVEAPDVRLVFGRHRVADDDDLRRLALHLRQHTLPRYVAGLCERYREGSLGRDGLSMVQVEEIAVAMMAWDPTTSRPWSCLPVFAVCSDPERPRYALRDLERALRANGVLYLADENATGVDFSAFDAPVLGPRQPGGAIDLLGSAFGERLVKLGAQNTVIEMPRGSRPELGAGEKRFERMLRFHWSAIRPTLRRNSDASTGRRGGRRGSLSSEGIGRMSAVCREARHASRSLENISWRVSWLVECDGTTPARSRRYLMKDAQTVVLNLYHREIDRLRRLSDRAPALAGHWGLASCLTDGTGILPHLTKEGREDLLLLDAMAKVGITDSEDIEESSAIEICADSSPSWLEFLRNMNDPEFDLS